MIRLNVLAVGPGTNTKTNQSMEVKMRLTNTLLWVGSSSALSFLVSYLLRKAGFTNSTFVALMCFIISLALLGYFLEKETKGGEEE